MSWNGYNKKSVIKINDTPPNRKSFGLVMAAIVLGAVVGVVIWSLTGEDRVQQVAVAKKSRLVRAPSKPRMIAKESVRAAMPINLSKKQPRKRHLTRNVEMFAHLSSVDRKLAEAVQDALDNDDFEKTVAAATAALASTNTEVRINAIEALGWFGAQALPELTGAMSDADEDVRNAAENHFELALNDIDKPDDQFKIAVAAFSSLADSDQLSSLGGIVNNAATELIDGEDDPEKAEANRVMVLQALVDIIDGEQSLPQNIEAAKEAYNDITGHEWNGLDEAEKYLSDPENYDPDDEK